YTLSLHDALPIYYRILVNRRAVGIRLLTLLAQLLHVIVVSFSILLSLALLCLLPFAIGADAIVIRFLPCPCSRLVTSIVVTLLLLLPGVRCRPRVIRLALLLALPCSPLVRSQERLREIKGVRDTSPDQHLNWDFRFSSQQPHTISPFLGTPAHKYFLWPGPGLGTGSRLCQCESRNC